MRDVWFGVVVQDLATQWIQSYPCKNKSWQETEKSLRKFLEPSQRPKVFYTDISLEFGKSCEELSWNHRTSSPCRRSETTGTADRAIRRVKEGTSAALLQSGLDGKLWSDSMECCCYLRDEGILLWHALFAERIWKGDILVADIEEFSKKLGASEILSQKTECKRSPNNPQRRRMSISCGRWFSNIIRKRLRIPRTPSETGTHRKERESQRRISRRWWRVSTWRNKKMTRKFRRTSGLVRET